MKSQQQIVNVKISRDDIYDILAAITFTAKALESEGYQNRKWEILHDKLKEQFVRAVAEV